jgi:hypothetical protein
LERGVSGAGRGEVADEAHKREGKS